MNVTVPSPAPAAVPTTLIHASSDSAVHAHLAAALTFVLLVPPSIGSETLIGEIAQEQGDAVGVEA
jgi:hypothetical protein